MDCEAKILGQRLSGKVKDKLKNCHDISIINFRFISNRNKTLCNRYFIIHLLNALLYYMIVIVIFINFFPIAIFSAVADMLLGNAPNIYLYACNNPSESTLAKRRGYGKYIFNHHCLWNVQIYHNFSC